jgi:general secretion pathway protein L
VVVLVPGTDVLLCRVPMPIRNQARLMRALPFTLEEQLAEDIERLHFAASRPDRGGLLRVAAVRRELMVDLVAEFAAAGLRPDAVYSDAEAVPANPGSLAVLLDGARIYLVPADGPPSVFDGLTLEQALDVVARDEAPRHLLVHCEEHHDRHMSEQWRALRDRGIEVDVHLQAEGALPRLAAGILAGHGVNLLQGEFAVRRSHGTLWAPWRVAAALLIALAGVAVVGKTLEYQRLRGEARALDEAIDASFRRSFGDVPVADYQLQARQLLARLRGGGAQAELITGLEALGGSMAQAGDGTRVLALSYRRGVLDLRVRAPDVTALDRLQRGLVEAGAGQAEIQAANPVDNGVEGRVQLRLGGGA